ncbi:MAG: B12-binding domain-containing radical SAM protein [Firmicutes bacterium]|nr:B12-binding domain-containing radical SAM protein [Bacillota bacterium]
MDLNLGAYEYFLSVDMLKRAGVPDFVAEQIEDIKSRLRSGRDFFEPDDYYGAVDTLDKCLSFVCGLYGNIDWSLKNFLIPYSPFSSEDIYRASADKKVNPFVEYFETRMDEIKEFNPELIGISTAWTSQIIPAFTLARTLKRHLPEVHVTMGGSMISHLEDFLVYKRNLYKFVDSFMVYDGEEGIAKLADCLGSGGSLADVPGLVYPEKKKIKANPPSVRVSLDTLPVPDYSDLPLDKYYSPQVYLPVAASRGCYWGKCTFCTHHLSGTNYRAESAERIFSEMNTLFEKYGCKNFYFTDDAMPPAVAKNLAVLISEGGKLYRWAAEFRAEKMMDGEYFKTLFEGGCRMALFGMESGSNNTLGGMNKGWEVSTLQEAVRHCDEAGIITWLFFMLGFPGETRMDALATFRFILSEREHINMVAGGTFVLTRNSEIYRNPEKFGVEILQPEKERDMPITFPYKVKEGIQKEEAEKLLNGLKAEPGIQKFLFPFVAETHTLFLEKNFFRKIHEIR